jgi:Glycosyl hydrolase catalytic core
VSVCRTHHSLGCLGIVFFCVVATGCASGGGPVTTVPAPSITSFAASVATVPWGTATALTAAFTNGTGSVNQSVGAVTSGMPVLTGNLSAATTFTLTVTNFAGSSASQQVTIAVSQSPVACTPTSKKGAGAWGTSLAPDAIDQLNIGWYYDWTPASNIVGYTGSAVFVPEFWDGSSITKVSGNSPWVFTFNEPDVVTQSNMTVAQAIADWPTVVADANGKLIGSPDIGGDLNSNGGSWLSSFMSSAGTAGDEVDFIALHAYPMGVGTETADQVSVFEDYITSVHNTYPSYPIVINEFALVNRNTWDATGMTQAAQVAFVNQVVPWMESQSWIIGYSWYAAYQGGIGSDLLNSDGTMSPIGAAYSQLGCR